MELVGERYRPALGTAIQVAFSLGYMLQPVIAYKLRDEFWYQVAATAPNLIFPFIVMYVQICLHKTVSLSLSCITWYVCVLFRRCFNYMIHCYKEKYFVHGLSIAFAMSLLVLESVLKCER